MSRRCLILVVGVAFSLVVAGFVAACDRSPTRPTLPVGPAGVPTTRVEIMGPGSVAPGQSAQLTAIAHRSDGTTADVTNTAAWRSSRSSVLSVSPSGLAAGHAPGDAVVTAVSGTSGAREIVVVPTGTYRLVGQIVEADSPTIPVPGTQVEVVGALPGLSAMTGQDGRYRLYGVPAESEIRVTKGGYELVVQRLSLSDHQTQNFSLLLAAPRVNVAGTYTLTLIAAGDCRASLPQEVWERRYTATIVQSGPLLDVTLTGATFPVNDGTRNRFRGRAEPGRAVFTIEYDFYYYNPWDIIEEVSPSLFFTFYGSVSAAVTPGNVSGALDGGFFTFNPGASGPVPFCRSRVHQFVLQR